MKDSDLTVQEAADILGKSPRWIQKLIIEGRLPASRFGKSYVISRSDLELVRGLQVGRPQKDKAAK